MNNCELNIMCVGRRRTKSHYPCCIGEPGVTLVLGIQTATTGQECAWLRDLRIHYMLGPDLKPGRWLQYTSCRADVGVPHKRQVPSPPFLDYITILNLKRTPWNDRRSPRAQEVPRIIPFGKYVRDEVSSHKYDNYWYYYHLSSQNGITNNNPHY